MHIRQQFVCHGPNRHSDRPVVELEMALSAAETAALTEWGAGLDSRLERLLGVLAQGEVSVSEPGAPESSASPSERYARLYLHTAMFLQRSAGHPVSETGMVNHAEADVAGLYFEFEEPSTAARVVELSAAVLGVVICRREADEQLRNQYGEFLAHAALLAMPADAYAIMEAARRRDVPVLRLDREPWEPVTADVRIRRNALLVLGFGCNRKRVEGTICIDGAVELLPLVADREQLQDHLRRLEVPLPERDLEFLNCNKASRAERSAARIGYPVTVKSRNRLAGVPVFTGLNNPGEVGDAARQVLAQGRRVIVERCVAGQAYRILVAGGEILGVLPESRRGSPDARFEVAALEPAEVHPLTRALVARIAASLPVGLMEVTVVTPAISGSLGEVGGAVVDVELAPELDWLAQRDPQLLRRAAERFVDWLFPEGATGRIPVVAVTGTNGKTSTCRMVERVMAAMGHTTGIACTDGVYIAGEQVREGDLSGLHGHLDVLASPQVTAAVLESARGGAVQFGLGFDHCDVATCLNVTRDHLGQFGIDTVEQMAAVKRSIVARARKGVVLNADDGHCLAMRDGLVGRRIALTSLRLDLDAMVHAYAGDADCLAGIQYRDGEEWFTLHEGGRHIPVMPVAAVPATHEGAARHYVHNALHALAVCRLLGIPVETLRLALEGFGDSYEVNPGRLNIHRRGGVTVIMDFAHNPSGVEALSRFVDTLPAEGRRLIALSCSGANSDVLIRETAAAAAGHFDHYVCKNFKLLYGREPHEAPALLREGLLEVGVEPSRISVVEDELDAVVRILEMAEPGDVAVIISGRKQRAMIWERITGDNPAAATNQGRTEQVHSVHGSTSSPRTESSTCRSS